MPQSYLGHRWSPITDLPVGHEELARNDLHALRPVWLEQKAELEASDPVKEFNKRLRRRWAVETGLIERLYTLDRGIAELLVERGLDASLISHGSTDGDPAHVMQLIRDQHDAVTGLFDFVAANHELVTSYIKQLHAVLTANQGDVEAIDPRGRRVTVPLSKGDYKLHPNNPREMDGRVHEYCPPEQVASEMDRLIEMHRQHDADDVAPEVQAAWLHHRFTQIHPFQDGNGRVARTLATLVLLKAGWFPLVITDDQRDDYIDALKAADAEDLRPLVRLFAKVEKKAFVDALGAAAQARQEASSKDALIAAMRDTFEKRRTELASEWDRAKELAEGLHDMAASKLGELEQQLESELGPLAPPNDSFKFFADRNHVGDDKSHWFRYQVIEAAKTLGYFANMRSYHAWARLVLVMAGRSEILLSLHVLGQEYRGVLVGSVCIYEKDQEGEFVYPASNVVALTDEPFQINYKEVEETIADRFAEWFDQAVIKGLAVVHKQL